MLKIHKRQKMLQSKTYKIKSCDDEELGIKRDSLLDYDDEKEMKALFSLSMV